MKALFRIVLVILNGLIAFILIMLGSGFVNITDGDPTIDPVAVIIGIALISTLIILWVEAGSKKQAEQLFWYVGIGFPIVAFIYLLAV